MIRFLRWSALAILTALSSVWPLSPSSAGTIPKDATGIWAETRCDGSDRVIVLNSSFALLFEHVAEGFYLIAGPAEWADGTPVLSRPEGVTVLPPIASLKRCKALPLQIYAMFGEAIALFESHDHLMSRCSTAAPGIVCAEAVFDFVNVSGDDRLSTAEISRTVRALSFFLGYEAIVSTRNQPGGVISRDMKVKLSDLYGSSLLSSFLAPFLTDTLLRSYDYDGDGFLALSEIIQDRGPLDAMAVAGGLQTAVAHNAVQSILRSVPAQMSGLTDSLLNSIFP